MGKTKRMNIVDKLAQTTLLDKSGNTIKTDDLWQNRDVILVFVRHFG